MAERLTESLQADITKLLTQYMFADKHIVRMLAVSYDCKCETEYNIIFK